MAEEAQSIPRRSKHTHRQRFPKQERKPLLRKKRRWATTTLKEVPKPFTNRSNAVAVRAASCYNIETFTRLDGDYKVLLPGRGPEQDRTLIKSIKGALRPALVERMTAEIEELM